MITINVPQGEVSAFSLGLPFCSCILGPYPLDGQPDQVISYRSPNDSIVTTKALYGENNVVHRQAKGSFELNLMKDYMRPSPHAPCESPNRKEIYNPRTKRWDLTALEEHINGSKDVVTNCSGGSRNHVQYTGHKNHMIVYNAYYQTAHDNSDRPWRGEMNVNRHQIIFQKYDKVTNKLHFIMNVESKSLVYDKEDPSHADMTYGRMNRLSPRDIFARGKRTFSFSQSRATEAYLVPNTFFVKDAKTDISRLENRAANSLSLVPEHQDFGILAMKASDNVAASNANMYEFLIELRNPKQLIPKLKNLTKLKTAAENYLTLNYGILPTISDLKEIFGIFKKAHYYDKNNFKVVTSVDSGKSQLDERTDSVSSRRVKLAIGDNDSELEKLLNQMDNIGFLPTFSNLYDLIPFSFVLDWFIDVGSFIERVDAKLRLARLDIRYSTLSEKSTIKINAFDLDRPTIVGDLEVVHYHRWTSDSSPEPPLLVTNKPTFQNHWIEAGALIIANRK